MSDAVVSRRDNRDIICQNALRIPLPQPFAVFILARALNWLIRSDLTPCLGTLPVAYSCSSGQHLLYQLVCRLHSAPWLGPAAFVLIEELTESSSAMLRLGANSGAVCLGKPTLQA